MTYAAALFAAMLEASSARAQAPDTRMYQRRVDSLARASREAQAQRVAYESSIARSYGRYDTIVVGPLRVAADSASKELARAAARLVLEKLTPWYARALDDLRTQVFVVREELERGRKLRAVARLSGDGGEGISMHVVSEPNPVAEALQVVVLQELRDKLDPGLKKWLGGQLPVDTARSGTWADARVHLLSSRATVARRCYAGDLHACKLTLVLEPADDPLLQWFDSTDRRRFVRESRGEMWRFEKDPASTNACLAGSDAACIVAIRRAGVALPAPVAAWNRVALVQLAASIGGDGAVARLLATAGGPSTKIAAAAGIPVDSLLSVWLGRVHGAQPGSQDMSVGIAASSLAWILLFGALSLRSGRWR